MSTPPPQPQKILVLGSTGPAGIAFLQHALSPRPPITPPTSTPSPPPPQLLIYARSPHKLPPPLLTHPRLTILPYNTLTDPRALRAAVGSLSPHSRDAVVSFLGPPRSQVLAWGNPWGGEGVWQGAGEGGGEEGGGKEEERGQDGNGDGDGGEQGLYSGVYRVVVAAMEARGVRRIFVLGTLSMEDGGDWGTGDGDGDGKAEGGKNGWRDWLWRKWTRFGVRVMVGVVWAFFWRGWWNMVEVGRYFDSLATAAGAGEAGTGVDWTVFRIGLLFNGDPQATAAAAGYLGDPRLSLSIRRSELARWLLGQCTSGDRTWVGRKPVVASAREVGVGLKSD